MNVCFPCFGRSNATDGERKPLLPKHHKNSLPDQSRPKVDKILDVLAAFNAGKLPTQAQLAPVLQTLLKSELLREDTSKVVPGNGPMSIGGRAVLGDIRGLVQAFLQFGLEKNADDILQQLYFQMKEIDVEKGVQAAADAAQKAADETGEGAEHVKDISSIQDEVSFDAATFLHAVRTLCEICLKSPSFRFILADLFAIVKDVVSLAAADVERAARQVQQDVQLQTQSPDDIIDKIGSDDIHNAGNEAADKIIGTAKQATQDLKENLTGLGDEASDKTKEKILQRVQEVLSRVQKDPASKGALRAILILARKYAEKIAAAAERSEEFVADLVDQALQDEAPNYPPQPYPGSPPKKPFIDASSDALLESIKEVLQRLAQGHALDGLLSAFGRVVHDLDATPLVLNEEVERRLNEEALESPVITEPPSPLVEHQPGLPANGKGKKNKKARMREKKAAEKAAKLSPTVSASQMTVSTSGMSTPPSKNNENPLRAYFAGLGAYMDKAIDEPGWAMSGEGAKTLEVLFDDGVELLNVVGESITEAGQDAADSTTNAEQTGANTNGSAADKSRRQFKADLKCLIDELEAYIAAAQSDKTTMGILHGLSALGDDLAALFMQGAKEGGRSLPRTLSGLRGWTAWVGWAVPRVLRMLPADTLPVPSIEVKTGNVEAALRALFVQGLARGPFAEVGASLVPDEVVLREWTEVRIDMAACAPGPGVQSTSRVHVHMDGVRARVADVGYYFKYAGALVGYEDEGVLSVDVGAGGLHEGLGADVELELKSDNATFAAVPEIVVHDAAGEVLAPNADMGPPAPAFRVVDVSVTLRGLRFRIAQSRHWLLNTLVLQHLAGPLVARLAQQALEERIRAALEVLAHGLGAVAHDAQEKAAQRRAGVADGEDGFAELLSDWWRALLDSGHALFGRTSASAEAQDSERVDVSHRTTNEATAQGIIHTETTTVVEPQSTPVMVYNPVTSTLDEINLSMSDIGGAPEVHEEETVVAVGAGPQLFPGKGGPYGATSDGRGAAEHIRDAGKKVVNGLRNGADQIAGVEGQWQKKVKSEERNVTTWKSKAFDF